jgi:antitoxin YefM
MTKNITLKDLRPRLPEVMDEIDKKMDRFIITKRGKPAAMMMAIEDYENLIETLDVLSNAGLMKKIGIAKGDLARGKTRSLEAIEKDMGLA